MSHHASQSDDMIQTVHLLINTSQLSSIGVIRMEFYGLVCGTVAAYIEEPRKSAEQSPMAPYSAGPILRPPAGR